MKALAADEAEALRMMAANPPDTGIDVVGGYLYDAHERMVTRGCATRDEDDEGISFEITPLGRLALRVSVPT